MDTGRGVGSTRLDDKVALVIGANGGIGNAVARTLAELGATVVVAARDQQGLRELRDSLTEAGHRAMEISVDVTVEDSIRAAIAEVVRRFGTLDVAVNNAAGGGVPPTPLAETRIEDFDSAWQVMARGTFLALKYEIGAMLGGSGGAVVNVASTAALRPVPGLSPYVASKAAVIALTQTAAIDYAAAGVRVNAVAPGPILTEHLEAAGPQAQQRMTGVIPMAQLGDPAEVAAAITWLASPNAAFVTGATVSVDGGLLAGMTPERAS